MENQGRHRSGVSNRVRELVTARYDAPFKMCCRGDDLHYSALI